MANPSKSKGSQFERKIAERLRNVGFAGAFRKKDNAASNDIGGLPWPVECKKRATWAIPEWARAMRRLHGDDWLLFVSPADTRRRDAPPELAVMPVEFALQLLAAHNVLSGVADDE